MPRLHSGAATDRPEVTHLTLPLIPEVVWQQPQETQLKNIHNDLTDKTHKHTLSFLVQHFLKPKKEMLYVPLDFENGLTIDALVDSGAYVSAIAQRELDRIQQQAPSNILKIDDTPIF